MADKKLRDRVIEGLGGSASADDASFRKLQEEVRAERLNNDLLAESFAQLELAIEEQGWRRFGAAYQHEFTRGALENLIQISQMMYMVNPLIKRAVNVKTYYTWGQGVEIEAKDEKIQNEVVGPMMEEDGNKSEFFSHPARLLTHVDQQVEGNVFFRMPTDMLGNVQIRSVQTEEIRDIHCKPGDPWQVWFYRRVWSEQEFDLISGETHTVQYDRLYPDYRYDPVSKPAMIGDKKVVWDEPIIHQKTGGLKHMQFGIPETYAALDWARAYKRFLEDWHTIVKSLSEFAWKRTTTAERMQGEKKKLESRRKAPVEGEEASNGDPLRRRAAGSVAMTTKDDDFAPIPKTGATVGANDARPSRLMVAAAMDLPDTILSGDVDIGNFATSKTLDRPTELAMVNEQLLWKRFEQEVYQYAIKAKIRRGMLPGTRKRSLDGKIWITEYSGDSEITLKYPPVLEHDPKEVVQAIVAAGTLEGKTYAGTLPREEMSRAMMNALGWERIDELVKDLPEEDQINLQAAVDALKSAAGTNPEPPKDAPPTP